MILTKFFRYKNPILFGLLPILFALLIDVPAYAQDKSPGEEKPTNIKWATKEDMIIINYDLNSPPEEKYDVSIIMKREGDASFSVIPSTVEGDIGVGLFAGAGREIRWYYRRDFPQGLQGSGYYFEIHVKMIKESSNLIYYIVGAAAVTGGLIVLLVSRNQNTTVPPLDLPTPPTRP